MPAAGDRWKCSSVLLISFRPRGTNTASENRSRHKPNTLATMAPDKFSRLALAHFLAAHSIATPKQGKEPILAAALALVRDNELNSQSKNMGQKFKIGDTVVYIFSGATLWTDRYEIVADKNTPDKILGRVAQKDFLITKLNSKDIKPPIDVEESELRDPRERQFQPD